MAHTPIAAFGRLTIKYSTYGHDHKFRVYVTQFGADSGVGTFSAPGTPADLDTLALDLANRMQGIINAAAAFSPGEWLGEVHVAGTDNSFVPIVTGVVGAITTTPNGSANVPGAPSQSTYTFRGPSNKLMKTEVFGAVYVAANILHYFDLSDGPKNFADYILGSSRIVGRSGAAAESLVSNTYDTNDSLQGRYRR